MERVVELQLPKRKNAYAIRNRHMVDLSQIVFGFWSGKGGGTIKTLKYALRQRKEVHAIPAAISAKAAKQDLDSGREARPTTQHEDDKTKPKFCQ